MENISPKDEFIALMERYSLNQKAVAAMLWRKPATVCTWTHGRLPVPPESLAMLRKIVAAIDAARGV